MSSRRFPGKVLAALWGKPILWHTIHRVIEAGLSAQDIVILTSTHSSDDAVAAYAQSIGFPVFRGPLEYVMSRFVGAINMFPCEWTILPERLVDGSDGARIEQLRRFQFSQEEFEKLKE